MVSTAFKGGAILLMIFCGAINTVSTLSHIQTISSRILNSSMKDPCINIFFIPICKYHPYHIDPSYVL